ncbi:MAG: tetratricopeptide repeat protein [Verrucomicrobia bacterium]|nr:tetratricopeptide repeat protein [Verrucomicrobiota bacterium]
MIRPPLRDPLAICAALLLLLPGTARLTAQGPGLRATPIQPGAGPALAPTAETMDTRLRFANMLYNYQKYEGAKEKYSEYLRSSPDGPESAAAWFRLGDCHRRLNAPDDAIRCLSNYLKLAPEGEFAAAAAFSIARIHFNADRYADSLPYWAMATVSLKDPEMKMETEFFYAQASQLSGKIPQAMAAYQKLVEATIEHRYRERSELELARLALEEGDKTSARKHFENLAAKAADPAIKDESRFRAGMLGLENTDTGAGETLLKETLSGSKNASFRQLAQMALMQKAYERQDYSEVIRLHALMPLQVEGTTRAQLDLMAANSLRQKKSLGPAIQLFDQIEKSFPGTAEATEAGYRKLLCAHEAGEASLPRLIDSFIATQSATDASSHYIDLAWLLKGETLFGARDFKGAAESYRNVRPENIDAKYGPSRLYKMGWAMIDSGSGPEGMTALEDFIKKYSLNPLVPSAMMKVAITHHQKEEFKEALEGYQRLVKAHPESADTQNAMTQIALIHRQLRQLEPMVAAYQALVRKFPDTPLKAEAHFWIGGGLFDLKKYKDCLEPLREARQLDAKAFGRNSSLRIVFALYHLEDLNALLEETRAFRAAHGDAGELLPIFSHLGRSFYEAGEYAVAEPYLVLRSDPANPKQTPADIWQKLADVHMRMKKFPEALTDLDHFLLHRPALEDRAKAILDKAVCLSRTGDSQGALAAAEEVLVLVRSGTLNNKARVLIGDIHLSRNDPNQAIQYYSIVVEFGADRTIVPLAMSKLAVALEAKGDADKAERYRKQLATDFPGFKVEDQP